MWHSTAEKKYHLLVTNLDHISYYEGQSLTSTWIFSQVVLQLSLHWFIQFSSVQSLSRVQLFETLRTAACQASLSIINSRSLLKLMSMESVIPSNHLVLSHPLLHPPSILPSIRVFSNESVLCIRWLNYWSFNFSISHSNEYLGLISFMMDWLDLPAVQGPSRVFSSSLVYYTVFKGGLLQAASFPWYTSESYWPESI